MTEESSGAPKSVGAAIKEAIEKGTVVSLGDAPGYFVIDHTFGGKKLRVVLFARTTEKKGDIITAFPVA